jgi:hypothetical protein
VALPVVAPVVAAEVLVPDVVEPAPEPVLVPPPPLVVPEPEPDVELPVPVDPDVVRPPSRPFSELKTSPPHPRNRASARTSKEVLDFMGSS